jgi:hypothetical protein
MITVTENTLQITIVDAAPLERRNWLIAALAAAMRWNALANGAKFDCDDHNQVVLAQLLEEMVDVKIADT